MPSFLSRLRFAYHKLKFRTGIHARRSYSQFGEDIFILNYFGYDFSGTFIDVGVLHPYFMSNTALLVDNGWTGINIEPNPDVYPLVELARPSMTNLQVAISNNRGTVDFVCNGSFSGIADSTYLWTGDGKSATVSVSAIPLSDVFDMLPVDKCVDLLDIDVEGHDFEVLISFDLSKYRPRLILIESHNPDPDRDIHGYLIKNKYSKIARLSLTDVYEDSMSLTRQQTSP
jgi:FkbM family methyltransferase